MAAHGIGGERVEEPRGFNSAEEYRAVQGLVRGGKYRDALVRAERALMVGRLGRKHTARLHSLICWLYTEGLHRTCPAAILHGEEAVRTAGLVSDAWVKCEALSRLVQAYCHMGQGDRAQEALDAIRAEFDRNPGVLTGGHPALCLLAATVAVTRGEERVGLALLKEGEGLAEQDATVHARLRTQRAFILLGQGALEQVRSLVREGIAQEETAQTARLEWRAAGAWLAAETEAPARVWPDVNGLQDEAASADHVPTIIRTLAAKARLAQRSSDMKEARRLAHLAFSRTLSAGRMDLARQLQRQLAGLV